MPPNFLHDFFLYDFISGLGRFPIHLNNIFFMINLLLPGTSVIYYGDEIGMSNNATDIAWDDVQARLDIFY